MNVIVVVVEPMEPRPWQHWDKPMQRHGRRRPQQGGDEIDPLPFEQSWAKRRRRL
jgi:hypothetical protein